ncbi:hypothetical protein SAMN06297422_10511 [Lachnospiraceae bacterium]|nr:hypothetical protein SAMN06297422_10511 [Lachnospiraceae bacterium]
MATGTELFDLKKVVEEYSEKKGYTEGVIYYYKLIKANKAVRHSEFAETVKKFGDVLDDFVKDENTTALIDLNNILLEFYVENNLPDIFIVEGLKPAFENMSEYLMHLRKLYNLDYYM